MELKKIEIEKYKSIKNPVTIEFNQGKPVVLIGKNGCGKTNILRAIKYSLSNSYYSQEKKDECIVKYYIDLSQDDFDTFFKDIDLKDDDNFITVYFNNGKPDIKFLDAPILFVSIEEYKERLEKILKDFQRASTKYINALKTIETKRDWFSYGLNPEILDEKGSIANLETYRIDNVRNNLNYQKKEIKDYFNNLFKEDKIGLSKTDYVYGLSSINWTIDFIKINEEKGLSISPIIAKSLGLKNKDIENANKKLKQTLADLNQKLSKEYNEIERCLDDFERIKKEICNIFQERDDRQYEIDEQHYNKVQSFIKKLKSIIFRNCYFLDNENSLIFFEKNNYYNQNNSYICRENLNTENPIMQAMDNFLQNKNVYQEKESILKLNELDEDRKKKFVRLINKEFLPQTVSNFDKDEIEGLQLENDFKLYIKEKSGERVELDNTSLGRRWYLTYQFIKALLKSGDMLLIDEPAAFLHPQAQSEFRKELESLKDIDVFYTTHSPYMIPEQWGNVHNVMMTTEGTTVQSFDNGDELCDMIRNDLGAVGSAEILFNLSKTTLLVEGGADKTCIEKFADLLGYDLSDYNILPCNGSPIFDVTYLCIKYNLKFKALLDRDNYSKPESWMAHKYGYKEYLNIFKECRDCVFTPEIRAGESLEDCFNELDNEQYFYDHRYTDKNGKEKIKRKICVDKIKEATCFQEETLKNFEQLFMDLGIPKIDKSIQ